MQAETVDEVKKVIENAADVTKRLNKGMLEKIERDGILDPLFCQIAHVETLEGHAAAAFVTRDGCPLLVR